MHIFRDIYLRGLIVNSISNKAFKDFKLTFKLNKIDALCGYKMVQM